MAATRWDAAKWKTGGKVGLLQAFGITKGAIKFPSLKAQLPSDVAQQMQKSTPGGTAPAHAKTYTQKQLQQLWIQAGGNPSKALIASAIAMAESSNGKVANAGATDHDSNGTVDKGLWQINSTHGSQSTYDPLANARAAVAISDNGTNWSPWVTYQRDEYQKYM